MDLSRTVSEIDGDCSRKSQNFPTSVFNAPAEGVHLELGSALGSKTRTMGYLVDKEVGRYL